MKNIKGVKHSDTLTGCLILEKKNILLAFKDELKVLNTYLKHDDGSELFNEYDERGLLIYEKTSNGVEATHEYNIKGDRIYSRYSNVRE